MGNGSYSSPETSPEHVKIIGEQGGDDIERMISSNFARFPKRFLVSSVSDGSLHRFVEVSTDDGGCISRLVISSSSSSSKDKSKSVRSDELLSVGCMNFIGRCFKLFFLEFVDNVQTLSILDNRMMRSTAVIPLLTSSSER